MPQSTAELETLALQAADGPVGGLRPAELHGVTVGIGIGAITGFELQDLVDLVGADALAGAEAVGEFVGATLDALHASDMSFALLLPDDEVRLEERLEALAEWCQGFLAGLVAGLERAGGISLDELPEEVTEIVRDLTAIAQLDTEQEEAEAEGDFAELVEYVKVGVLLILSIVAELDSDGGSDAGDDR